MSTSHRPWRRRLRIVWMLAGVTFTAWLVWNMQAHGVNADVFRSSSTVTVERFDHATAFIPVKSDARSPFLIFLPGGAVDPAAYGPFVRAVADQGWAIALVELPWRVAFTASQQAEVWRRVDAARQHWASGRSTVLGGHSRGAALSARFAADHPETLAGVFLIGTTHPRDFSLTSLGIPLIKISGSRDCVAPVVDSQANRHLLPSSSEWVVIEGANHGQFGYYGSQLGDCSADISRSEQQQHLLSVMSDWLQETFELSTIAHKRSTSDSRPSGEGPRR